MLQGDIADESARNKSLMLSSVLPFQPKYRLGHPENYLFLPSKKYIYRIKVSNNKFNKF